MKTVHTVAELRAVVAAWRKAGQRVGFVPTMGNLHAGHVALIARARELSDRVVASVFVNPLQFAPDEDFDAYPRTLDADSAKLKLASCDLLFAPSVAEMYPAGRDQHTTITVPGISEILDGVHRPGHFTGVATVVAKLFDQVQPDVAVFGEKDYQQLKVVERMVRDLALPVRVVGLATVREDDGLALSSRNQYLSPAERAIAPLLHATLTWAAEQFRHGRPHAEVEGAAAERLRDAGFKPDYVSLRSADDLGHPIDGAPKRVFAAAWLGAARLIDNVPV
jgi:pantoate--beta-alanine ligase